jgi:valyl-tRNA synthetase
VKFVSQHNLCLKFKATTSAVEEKWYQFWLDQNVFVADPARVTERRPAYSMVIPPPNVTGVLHMGHVLNNTIQDILARKARMDGKEVLWLPGTDHAGIATQTVVERTLKKQGVIRHRDDLGREKFVEKVWEWKEKHGGIIIQQLKKLGARATGLAKVYDGSGVLTLRPKGFRRSLQERPHLPR